MLYVAHKHLGHLWNLNTSALLSTSTLSTGLDQREEGKTELQVETKAEAAESCRGPTECTEGRPNICHHVLSCLVFAGIWLGFLTALVLTLIGIWTRYRNCLTIGVILAIVCLGVAIQNCLQRGDTTPSSPISIRRNSQFAVCFDDLDIAKLEVDIAKAEAGADAASKYGSGNLQNEVENQNIIVGSGMCRNVPTFFDSSAFSQYIF